MGNGNGMNKVMTQLSLVETRVGLILGVKENRGGGVGVHEVLLRREVCYFKNRLHNYEEIVKCDEVGLFL